MPGTHNRERLGSALMSGVGGQVLHTNTGDVIAHGGDNPGFHSFSAASIARGTAMVAMTNGDSGPDVITRIVFGDTMRRILAR